MDYFPASGAGGPGSDTTAWHQGGDEFGETGRIGTNDANELIFRTFNNDAWEICAAPQDFHPAVSWGSLNVGTLEHAVRAFIGTLLQIYGTSDDTDPRVEIADTYFKMGPGDSAVDWGFSRLSPGVALLDTGCSLRGDAPSDDSDFANKGYVDNAVLDGIAGIATVPVADLVDPNYASLDWRNQGGASATPDGGKKSIVFLDPAVADDNVRLYKEAVSGNWSIEIGFSPGYPANVNYVGFGLAVNNHAGGDKVLGVFLGVNGRFDGLYNAGLSTWGTVIQADQPFAYAWPNIFMKVTDDGTTYKFYVSPNGLDWLLQYSEAHATRLGDADEAGLVMIHRAGDMVARLFHYKKT